jgi:hypothetical protein
VSRPGERRDPYRAISQICTGDRSFSPLSPVVMGPGFRRGDDGGEHCGKMLRMDRGFA